MCHRDRECGPQCPHFRFVSIDETRIVKAWLQGAELILRTVFMVTCRVDMPPFPPPFLSLSFPWSVIVSIPPIFTSLRRFLHDMGGWTLGVLELSAEPVNHVRSIFREVSRSRETEGIKNPISLKPWTKNFLFKTTV